MIEKFTGGSIVRRQAEAEYWFLGDPFDVLASAEDTGGAYALMAFSFRPGSGAPPHRHAQEDEFFYIVEGELEFHAAGNTIRAVAGDFVQLVKGEEHFFVNPLDRPARVLIGIVPADFLGFFLELSTRRAGSPTPPPMPPFETIAASAAKYGVILTPPA